MNSNQIMKADILDIVFENRNKAYGAYTLRKFYPNRLKLALAFMFIIAIVFSGFTIMPDNKVAPGTDIITCPIIPETELREVIIPPLEPEQNIKAEQPVANEPAKSNQTIFNSNLLIVDSKIETAVIHTILPTDVIGTENIDNADPAPALVTVQPQSGPSGVENTATKIDINTPMDAAFVEVLPSFPGGTGALKKFLEKNLENPYDRENGEIVNVKVRFVVGYDGKLKSFTVLQDGGEIYNKEVMRVLKKMPDWIPGKAKGENVSVYYTIPVKFVMSN